MKGKGEVRLVIAQDESGKAELSICCSREGFYLVLRCLDGSSYAISQVPWHDIVQAVYRSDPDMFGVLDEPVHFIFPRTMEVLGYKVPSRRIREVRRKLGYCWLDRNSPEELLQEVIEEI